MEKILQEIRDERSYQKQKWGTKYNDDDWTNQDWSRFILEYLPAEGMTLIPLRHPEYGIRIQLLKVAALAVAAIEAIDRKESK